MHTCKKSSLMLEIKEYTVCSAENKCVAAQYFHIFGSFLTLSEVGMDSQHQDLVQWVHFLDHHQLSLSQSDPWNRVIFVLLFEFPVYLLEGVQKTKEDGDSVPYLKLLELLV